MMSATRLIIHVGWKGLEPQFTLTRKVVDKPDEHLPSVNTCFVYLKLPEYSSKKVLHERLLYAMTHGQNSFDLS